MATIRKRGDKWQVQVRRVGSRDISRSFCRKADAKTWAAQIEAEADRHGLPADPRALERVTVTDVLERYRDTIVARKRGKDIETIIIDAFLRRPLAKARLSDVTPTMFSDYRDERLQAVKPATINRELGIIQHAFDIARKEWGIPLRDNPLKLVRKPMVADRRDRRVTSEEWARLLASCRTSRNLYLEPVVRLAVETSMRRGELLAMRWKDVDLEKGLVHIPITKNGHARTIPLTGEAKRVIKGLAGRDPEAVLPMTMDAFKTAWRRLTARANVHDLRFHDLRHEAISRFFEMGLSMPEVAVLSGHRDPRMLFRYTHLRAEDVARKL